MQLNKVTSQIPLLQKENNFQESDPFPNVTQENINPVSNNIRSNHLNSDASKLSGFISHSLVQHKNMGLLILKPIEVRFQNQNFMNQKNLYCKFKLGMRTQKIHSFLHQDGNLYWNNFVTFKVKDQGFLKLKVKENLHRLPLKNKIGESRISLDQVFAFKKICNWVPLFKNHLEVGKVLLEMEFQER